MKFSLLLAALLLLGTSAQAQGRRQSPLSENPGFLINNGYSGSGGGSYGEIGSSGRRVKYEDPRNFTLGYVTNDGPFVPSTFMKYEDALELGKQQLAAAAKAAAGEAGPSLAEVARSYRTMRVPTLKLQARVTQDDAGRLEVCNLNGNDCHRP